MTVEKDWPRVAVVGAGAVGGYFGGMTARGRSGDDDWTGSVC